jgi:hypothetical protein
LHKKRAKRRSAFYARVRDVCQLRVTIVRALRNL